MHLFSKTQIFESAVRVLLAVRNGLVGIMAVTFIVSIALSNFAVLPPVSMSQHSVAPAKVTLPVIQPASAQPKKVTTPVHHRAAQPISRVTVPLNAHSSAPVVADLSDAARIAKLINLAHLLPSNYVPSDLVRVADYGIATAKDANSSEMRLRLAQDADSTDPAANLPSRLGKLLDICRAETDEVVALRSGYRSYSTQAALFARRGFVGGNTAPGSSEHQSGLAFDLAINGQFITAQSKTYGCLTTHASDYGFILSYPSGNRYLAGHAIVEPWHWRYVGVSVALFEKAQGMTSKPQEFLATLPENSPTVIPQTIIATTLNH